MQILEYAKELDAWAVKSNAKRKQAAASDVAFGGSMFIRLATAQVSCIGRHQAAGAKSAGGDVY